MTSRPSRASCWPNPRLGPRRRWNGLSRYLKSWGPLRKPVPFTAVHFRDLGAQGEVGNVERFSPGLSTFFASSPNLVTTSAQLMRSGFAVRWAPGGR